MVRLTERYANVLQVLSMKHLPIMREDRFAQIGSFFKVKGSAIARSSAVSRQLQKLRHEMLRPDSPLPENLDLFFDTIDTCFEIEGNQDTLQPHLSVPGC